MTYVVAVKGIDALQTVENLDDKLKTFAMRAVNYATKRARTEAQRRMLDQANFKASYLSESQGRLTIGRPATKADLQSKITGRFAPTSLARFVVGSPKAVNDPGRGARWKSGVKVEVKPGDTKLMKRAFIFNLRQGKVLDAAGGVFNKGLAIRLKPGETISNKYKQVKTKDGLTLLYSVSVDQLLSTIAPEMLPQVEDWLNDEFERQVAQFNAGNIF